MIANPMQRIGLGILILYLFILYSRVFDVKFAWLHIPALMLALLILLSVSSMQLFSAFSTQIGKYLGLFTLWALVGVPFSVWRSGAFVDATQVWPRALMVFLALACLVTSLAGVRRAIITLGFAIIVLGLISHLFGQLNDGRLFLPQGKFSNPNDLAQAVLMGFPFLLFTLMEGNKATKALVLVGAVPLFGALMRTGSRGGMLGFIVILLFGFFRCSLGGKMLAVAGGVGVLLAAMVVLPQSILARYTTLFHPDASVSIEEANNCPTCMHLERQAAGSANERYQLLLDGIRYTFENPVLGVGIGRFATARDQEADRKGIFLPSRVPHNSYVELSSETGLVGFFFYMTAFIGSMRLCHRLSKFADAKVHPEWRQISRLAFCLQMSLTSYAVTSFFASVSYQQYFPTLAGLVLALKIAVEPAYSEWRRQTEAAARTPLDFAPRRLARREAA